MENISREDECYSAWLLLGKVRRIMLRVREQELRQWGVTPEQAGVLHIIHYAGEKITPSEISRLTLREPHTVSALISRMEKSGLVKKVKDMDRKNLVRVTLTEKGRQAYLESAKRQSLHRIMSCLSKEECEQLRLCLEKLRDNTTEMLAMARDHRWYQQLEQLG